MTSSDEATVAKEIRPRVGAAVLSATFALNILALALPLVVLQIFDRVIPFQATETLVILFLGMCLVAILEFTLKWARVVLLSNVGEVFDQTLTTRFMQTSLNADPTAFAKVTPAAHLDHFGAISQVRTFYAGQGRILAIDLPFAALFVAMIGLIGGWLVLVPLASIALLIMFKIGLKQVQSSVFEERKKLDDRRYSFLVEVLSQIKTLKANAMEAQIKRRYELLQDQTVDISQRVIKISGFSQSFGALFSQMAVAAMGLFGGYLIIVGNLGIAELAACMLLNGRTIQPMLKTLNLWVQSENLSLSRSKLDATFALPSRTTANGNETPLAGRVCFEDVALKHPTKDGYLFQGLNADIMPNQSLALLGNASSGKSALMQLILGEKKPTKGRVLVDGVPAHDMIHARGTGGIGYADQQPVVFAGTVLSNISAFGDGESIARALEFSERLGLDKALHRLPLGYNTLMQDCPALTNNQAALLGISLVRAMALQPKILLLNDVTATMDKVTRDGFLSLIKDIHQHTTLIIASMDQELLEYADASLNLNQPEAKNIDAWIEDGHADRRAAKQLMIGPLQERSA
ncbi:ABC transporter ATP-binding protein [Roseobacter denitrificans]|uniref:Toxin secretion ABC transporter, ATP binding protein, putative n=1 Tax=Roseobacter denitrificans (strain ATCC 33942 / OCh 114) TaxID=375451 RepID=Q161Z6_ROSDO|nr:ABC transporter transmembrane domain-containing protein [Roseobacter denitrificans]ABG33197.1 toxin secretion ABC transporter, ATP binding protein, putative [Roseobacter denitrificans OCh 114]AVL52547.1 ABC transporter ATP-binding protein [Roseobacter denitrificans]SFG29773.1 ATP-binding cassette, subfamily C, LapB [Roseobacter denitrificans OCh 114]